MRAGRALPGATGSVSTSGRFALPAFSLPGPSRRRCGKSWSSCTATVSARRGAASDQRRGIARQVRRRVRKQVTDIRGHWHSALRLVIRSTRAYSRSALAGANLAFPAGIALTVVAEMSRPSPARRFFESTKTGPSVGGASGRIPRRDTLDWEVGVDELPQSVDCW
jgi:hypothetical protein